MLIGAPLPGVPYRTSPREIIDFFAGYDIIPESVQVRASSAPLLFAATLAVGSVFVLIRNLLFPCCQLGRDQAGFSTGEAWVSFKQAEEGYRALREKNRGYLGSRYVELFLA
jgi:hypothetical protein